MREQWTAVAAMKVGYQQRGGSRHRPVNSRQKRAMQHAEQLKSDGWRWFGIRIGFHLPNVSQHAYYTGVMTLSSSYLQVRSSLPKNP